ncbi:Capsule biosynthesis protein CapA [Exaiptasia diaphana]|nr:Capsule biosynthesis protein CapA [Exaiptasia diaphana]
MATEGKNDKTLQSRILRVEVNNFDGAPSYYHRHEHCSYNDSFANVAAVLKQADLVIGNLENSFIREDMRKDALNDFVPLLSAEPKTVEALKFAGFDLLTLANNHLNDYKTKPVNFTVEILKNNGILPFGYSYGSLENEKPQTPVRFKINGIKIGFLGYCKSFVEKPKRGIICNCIEKRRGLDAGPAIYEKEAVTRDVKDLKSKVDVIVVFMHWGVQYLTEPTELQRHQEAHLKSLGVHAIIGSHPHVLEGHSLKQHSLVAYSLGNFLFGPKNKNWWFYDNKNPSKKKVKEFEHYVATEGKSDISLTSRILRVEINKKGVTRAAYLPLRIIQNQETKCFQTAPEKDAKWIRVCEDGDEDCLNET